MIADHVIASLQPSLRARAFELEPSTADDLLQETYLRLVEKAPDFRGEQQLKRWLRTVMRNLHVDRLRARTLDWR